MSKGSVWAGRCARIGIRSVVALMLAKGAAGQVWDGGGGNSDWNTAANWNPDGVPDGTLPITQISNDDVTVTGTIAQPLNLELINSASLANYNPPGGLGPVNPVDATRIVAGNRIIAQDSFLGVNGFAVDLAGTLLNLPGLVAGTDINTTDPQPGLYLNNTQLFMDSADPTRPAWIQGVATQFDNSLIQGYGLIQTTFNAPVTTPVFRMTGGMLDVGDVTAPAPGSPPPARTLRIAGDFSTHVAEFNSPLSGLQALQVNIQPNATLEVAMPMRSEDYGSENTFPGILRLSSGATFDSFFSWNLRGGLLVNTTPPVSDTGPPGFNEAVITGGGFILDRNGDSSSSSSIQLLDAANDRLRINASALLREGIIRSAGHITLEENYELGSLLDFEMTDPASRLVLNGSGVLAANTNPLLPGFEGIYGEGTIENNAQFTARSTAGGRPNATVDFVNNNVLLIEDFNNTGDAYFTVDGFTQSANAQLLLETTNTAFNPIARLIANGPVHLDGTFRLFDILSPGFSPTAGDAFEVITTTDTVTGTFHTINDSALDDSGLGVQLIYLPQSVIALIVADTLAGDYDNSGAVDQGDLDLVLLNWGEDTSVTGVPAGWVNEQPTGVIGQTQLDGVLLNWGNTAEASATNVPEPATAALLALGGLALTRRQ